MTKKEPSIRVKAVMIIEHNDRFLLEESYDREKDASFYMPFGGGIEFGESSLEAAIREVKEELGIDVPAPELVGVKENRFTFEGDLGHDIVFIYHTVLLADFDRASITPEIYRGKPLKPVWLTLQEIGSLETPLYPEGLIDILTSRFSIPY